PHPARLLAADGQSPPLVPRGALRSQPLGGRERPPAPSRRLGSGGGTRPNRHGIGTDTCAEDRYRRARGWRVVPHPRWVGVRRRRARGGRAMNPDFGRLAPVYDRIRPVDENWWEVFEVVVREGDLRGRRVLDLGCGTGRLSGALADRGLA